MVGLGERAERKPIMDFRDETSSEVHPGQSKEERELSEPARFLALIYPQEGQNCPSLVIYKKVSYEAALYHVYAPSFSFISTFAFTVITVDIRFT